MATVDPEDIVNVIKAQHNWLSIVKRLNNATTNEVKSGFQCNNYRRDYKLQEADRTRPIKIKVIEGEMPRGCLKIQINSTIG